jgi:predicted membrane channel-forming protein YqfA (hemolysin III family)
MDGEKVKLPVITTSFLVLGNCLGVGVLAPPIKYGLAGLILTKIAKKRYAVLRILGYIMFIIGCLITAYVIADKIGLIDLVPPMPKM